MDPIVLKIEGMTCSHCVRAAKGVLEAVSGVAAVTVSLETGTAEIIGTPEFGGLLRAVTAEGYIAKSLS